LEDVTQTEPIDGGLQVKVKKNSGLIIADEQGRELFSISEVNGLCSNQVTHVAYDGHGLLWGATAHGIFAIEIPSVYSYLLAKDGLSGEVHTIIAFDGKIYAGGTNGLYYVNKRSIHHLPDINNICWTLCHHGDHLLAATSSGTYRINPGGSVIRLTSNATTAMMKADIYDYDFIGNFTSNRLRGAWSQFEANELNEYAAITDSNPRALVYDADGNLLTNGVWSYSYDSRNRLSSICSNDVLLATEIYDANSRRVTTESHNETQRHLYDVWNEIRESDSNGNIPSDKDRFWGKDLSGALQGAGGIGGLICESFSGNSYFPACDNLGNIVIYSGANGFIVASYRYDAFGNILFEIGAPTAEFLYRFSSKPFDRGLYYYGYRFFSSDLGRWLARDPEGEIDAKQLFCAFGNNAFSFFDYLGRSLKAIPYQDYPVKTELPYFKLIITWQLDSPATNTGVVIQHMKLSRDICDCSGNKLVDDVREYWEIVGIIKKGKVTTDDTYNKLFNGDDLWEFPKGRTLPNTRGTVTWEGDPVFYPGITNVVGFAVEANSPADHAPISWNQPQGLPEGIQGEHRTDSITWDRCK